MSAALTHDVFKIPNWKYLFSLTHAACVIGGRYICVSQVAQSARRSFPLRLNRGEGQGEVSIRSSKSAFMPFPRTLPIRAKRKQNAIEAFDPPSTINFQPSTAPNKTRGQMDRTLRGMAGGQWVFEKAVKSDFPLQLFGLRTASASCRRVHLA